MNTQLYNSGTKCTTAKWEFVEAWSEILKINILDKKIY